MIARVETLGPWSPDHPFEELLSVEDINSQEDSSRVLALLKDIRLRLGEDFFAAVDFSANQALVADISAQVGVGIAKVFENMEAEDWHSRPGKLVLTPMQMTREPAPDSLPKIKAEDKPFLAPKSVIAAEIREMVVPNHHAVKYILSWLEKDDVSYQVDSRYFLSGSTTY